MKKFALLLVLGTLVCGPAALAEKGGKGHTPPPPKQVKVKQNLLPTPIPPPADLAAAAGKFDYKKNKGRTDLTVDARVPLAAATLGITDQTTAKAADVHVEITVTRADAAPIVSDCKLALMGGDEPAGESARWHFRVKAFKNTPKARLKNVKGLCAALPDILPTDALTILVYANVAGNRLDFLANPPK